MRKYMDSPAFSDLDNEAPAATAAVKKNDEKKGYVKEFAAKLQTNPELKEALFTLSDSLEVVNTCGYGDNGGVVQVSKGVKGADGISTGRELGATSKIVGYIVRNVGDAPIAFQNGVWTKNAQGVYEEQVIEDVINPGDSKAIDRKYLTLLTVKPEFSFTLANGKIVGSSSTKKAKNIEDVIASYHFKFKDTAKTVHDDEVKIAIADKREVNINGVPETKWVIKPEYETVFGYLSNPKAQVRRSRAVASDGIDIKTAAGAAFVRDLLAAKGVN